MSETKDEKQNVEEKPTPEPVIEDVNSNENPGAEKIDESFSEKANQFADKSAEVAEKIYLDYSCHDSYIYLRVFTECKRYCSKGE